MIENLGIFAILVAGGLGYASDYFGLPWLASVAIIVFGMWLAGWGVEIAFKGQVTLINREYRRYELFSGIPAGLWAAIFITAGCLILLFGFLDLVRPGGSESFLGWLASSPTGWGTILGIVGMFVTASGVIRILAGSATDQEEGIRMQELGYRLVGAWRTFLGLIILLLAVGLIFTPNFVRGLFDALFDMIKSWFLSI